MRRPLFPTSRMRATMACCLVSVAVGCAKLPAQSANPAAPPRPRGEDLRLLARLGGPSALAVISRTWAQTIEARARLPYDQAAPQTQAWLRCAVDPAPDRVRAKGPPPASASLLPHESASHLYGDLKSALHSLRITVPEQQELVRELHRCLPVHVSH